MACVLEQVRKLEIMGKQYIEAGVLTIVYFIASGVTLSYFGETQGVLRIIMYPAEICLGPILNSNLSIEKLNFSLFGLYFLWSLNCVYLSVIKSSLKQLGLVPIKKP